MPLTPSCPQEDEVSLSNSIQEAQAKVHEALLDNINTGAALDALGALIKATNTYLATKQAAAAAAGGAGDAAAAAVAGLTPAGPKPLLLRKAAAYVTRILSVFGLLPVSKMRNTFACFDSNSLHAAAACGHALRLHVVAGIWVAVGILACCMVR
jgi:cysteinyl-tRNA synthetase